MLRRGQKAHIDVNLDEGTQPHSGKFYSTKNMTTALMRSNSATMMFLLRQILKPKFQIKATHSI